MPNFITEKSDSPSATLVSFGRLSAGPLPPVPSMPWQSAQWPIYNRLPCARSLALEPGSCDALGRARKNAPARNNANRNKYRFMVQLRSQKSTNETRFEMAIRNECVRFL